jgi:hypothetical protein
MHKEQNGEYTHDFRPIDMQINTRVSHVVETSKNERKKIFVTFH